MKILINAVSARWGGAATYIRNLARELAGSEDQYIFCVPEAQAGHIRGLASHIRVVPSDDWTGSLLKHFVWDQVMLPGILRQERVDLLFASANFSTFLAPCPQLLLVRIPVHFADLYLKTIFPRKSRRLKIEMNLRRWLICRSARRADLVMTPSHAMMDDLLRFVQIPEERRVVNHYGTSEKRFRRNGRAGKKGRQDRMDLLYVTHYADYKNFFTLLRALVLLRDHGVSNFRFTTTADPWNYWPHLSVTREEDIRLFRELDGWVETVGLTPYERIHELYERADVKVYPSLAESFGHPLIEGMAAGLPIVASDIPIHREVCGEAASYFPPLDPCELAGALGGVLRDGDLRDVIRRQGEDRIKRFRWRDHVDRLVSAFRETCER